MEVGHDLIGLFVGRICRVQPNRVFTFEKGEFTDMVTKS